MPIKLNKKKFRISINIFLITLISGFTYIYSQSEKKFTYTGSTACGECHGQESIGNQNKIWKSSPHARAYRTLKNEKASEIAKDKNIKDPSSDAKCLKCHATGGGKTEALREEGVGCEACHGPGSVYSEMSVHVDFTNRESAYNKAIKYGMYPILGIKHLKKREKLCLHCHNSDRPCFPTDSKEIQRQQHPIQVIDTLKKTDVDFNHRLRR
jgi:hypothetical protein